MVHIADDKQICEGNAFARKFGLCHFLVPLVLFGIRSTYLLMNVFLVYYSCGLAFIVGKRPEEPEDGANSHAHSRIPEGKYQREQITGNAQ